MAGASGSWIPEKTWQQWWNESLTKNLLWDPVVSVSSLAGDAFSGELPMYEADPLTGEVQSSQEIMDRSMEAAGLLGAGTLVAPAGGLGLAVGGASAKKMPSFWQKWKEKKYTPKAKSGEMPWSMDDVSSFIPPDFDADDISNFKKYAAEINFLSPSALTKFLSKDIGSADATLDELDQLLLKLTGSEEQATAKMGHLDEIEAMDAFPAVGDTSGNLVWTGKKWESIIGSEADTLDKAFWEFDKQFMKAKQAKLAADPLEQVPFYSWEGKPEKVTISQIQAMPPEEFSAWKKAAQASGGAGLSKDNPLKADPLVPKPFNPAIIEGGKASSKSSEAMELAVKSGLVPNWANDFSSVASQGVMDSIGKLLKASPDEAPEWIETVVNSTIKQSGKDKYTLNNLLDYVVGHKISPLTEKLWDPRPPFTESIERRALQAKDETFTNMLDRGMSPEVLYIGRRTPRAELQVPEFKSEQAFFAASDPRVAKEYGKYIYPVHMKMENPLVKDWKGQGYDSQDMKNLIEDAIGAGHDSAVIRSIMDIGPPGPQDQFLAFPPSRTGNDTWPLRSIWAKFDPKKKGLSDLLAGLAGGSAAVGLTAEDETQAQADRLKELAAKLPQY